MMEEKHGDFLTFSFEGYARNPIQDSAELHKWFRRDD